MILYLECHMGAAGDMLTAALYELLDDKEGFIRTMNGLNLPGVRVEALPAASCGIAGTRMKVSIHGAEEERPEEPQDHHHEGHEHHGEHDHHHEGHEHPHEEHDHHHGEHDHHHTALSDIRGLIAALPLPEAVKIMAGRVYDRLAQAEARAHGCPVDLVHFHEVGALDAVADVVGACYALSLLKPDRVVVSPIHVGSGQVRCAHGTVPVPAPATAALLEGVPCYGGEVKGELCTPTGAALLSAFAQSYGPMPVMTLRRTGYGMGKKEFKTAANCVRALLGESLEESTGEISELVCNLDDMTPEALAHACARLLDDGALDVYTVPSQMKKGRPGWVLTVLCPPEREEAMAKRIFAHTTTNGLRVRRCGKYFLAPGMETVDTRFGPVRMKTAQGYGVSRRKPEYDDVSAAAKQAGVPFGEVWREADRAEVPQP